MTAFSILSEEADRPYMRVSYELQVRMTQVMARRIEEQAELTRLARLVTASVLLATKLGPQNATVKALEDASRIEPE